MIATSPLDSMEGGSEPTKTITAASPPPTVAPLPIAGAIVPPTAHRIPLPNYNDTASRLQYTQNFLKKYGPMVQGRGDTVLNVNEIPRAGTTTAKNMSQRLGQKYGVDPSLLYTSAMEEGMSALFKNKITGIDTKGRKPSDPNYMEMGWNKDYSVKHESLGLNTFNERYPELVQGGYLPKDFKKNFSNEGFRSVESAMEAKAALMKFHYDDIDKYARQNGIALSPKARDFFALADYSGGEGMGHKMLSDYSRNGYLENDKFLQNRPVSGTGLSAASYGPTKTGDEGAYAHLMHKMKLRDAIKNEGYFQ